MKKIIKSGKADLNEIIRKKFKYTGINEYLRKRHNAPSDYFNKESLARSYLEEEFRADNQLKPLRELHRARSLYKDHLEDMFDITYSYDLWSDKNKYGLVDMQNDPIMLKTDPEGYTLGLFPLSGQEDGLFAIDFVADAFSSFRNYYNNKAGLGNISTQNTILPGIEARRAWMPFNDEYSNHIQNIYEIFVSYVYSADYIKQIDSFDTFLPIYLEFVGLITKESVFTKQAYAKSLLRSYYSSGLMIDIKAGADFGDDKEKISFIQDKNFSKYHTIAKSFGFRLDRNAPWRLIGNLESSYMQEMMSLRGASYEEKPDHVSVFEKYYKKVDLSSFSRFKSLAFRFYNKLAMTSPSSRTPSGDKDSIDRNMISAEHFNKKYNDFFWLGEYFKTRLMEEKITLNDNQIYFKTKHSYALKKTIDIKAALGYLDKEIKLLKTYTYKKANYQDKCT